MPLKTWAPYERLLAEDLNAAFAWSQDATLPGAWSLTAGGDTASTAANSYAEPKHGAPPAGADPYGIWQASGRLIIPAGMGGLWMYSNVVSATGGTTNDQVLTYINVDGVRLFLSSIGRYTSTATPQTGTLVTMLNAGSVLYAEARPLASSAIANARTWSLMRLGRGVGAPGVVPAVALGALPGPGDIGEGPDEGPLEDEGGEVVLR
jgi:hypothetical protein